MVPTSELSLKGKLDFYICMWIPLVYIEHLLYSLSFPVREDIKEGLPGSVKAKVQGATCMRHGEGAQRKGCKENRAEWGSLGRFWRSQFDFNGMGARGKTSTGTQFLWLLAEGRQ